MVLEKAKFDRKIIKSLLDYCKVNDKNWITYRIDDNFYGDAESYVRNLLEFSQMRAFHNIADLKRHGNYEWATKAMQNIKLMKVLSDKIGRPDFVVIDRIKYLPIEELIPPFFIEVKLGSDRLNTHQTEWISRHREFPIIILHINMKLCKGEGMESQEQLFSSL